MPKTLIKSRLFPSKQKLNNKPELNNTKWNLPPTPQKYKQKLLSGNGFIVYK